jgi:glycosyltransferase involved in cell wall biosynthesis
VAELDGSADVELLLRALRLLQDEGVRAECAVIGEGPQEHRLRRLAHGLGLRRETHFLTALLDPQPILAETALVVLLPRRQLPVLSILEAQAAGRAVISARVPGIGQFVEEGVTGQLLPKATPQVLASLIKELLLDPEARRRLGEEARRRALGSASLPSVLEATVLLYDSLAAPHPDPLRPSGARRERERLRGGGASP